MKLGVTVLSVALLVAALCPPAHSAPMGSDPPTACCFSYTLRQLPRHFVIDYFETSSLCSQPAVVTHPGRIPIPAAQQEPWSSRGPSQLQVRASSRC
uniref:Chemokine (C-C motif) ligand 4 n=2 Tax=Oryctolagus cuniculus TaxID=9986 RepID=A0A5F9CRU0_RABIT